MPNIRGIICSGRVESLMPLQDPVCSGGGTATEEEGVDAAEKLRVMAASFISLGGMLHLRAFLPQWAKQVVAIPHPTEKGQSLTLRQATALLNQNKPVAKHFDVMVAHILELNRDLANRTFCTQNPLTPFTPPTAARVDQEIMRRGSSMFENIDCLPQGTQCEVHQVWPDRAFNKNRSVGRLCLFVGVCLLVYAETHASFFTEGAAG